MKQVPITRFRREIRKWIRKEENIEITRRKKVILVFLNVGTYNTILRALEK
jgi:hypothetical protein